MNNIGYADLKLLKELCPNDFANIKKKLEAHYPIQYLIGYVDFYNTKINVNEDVLIPRFETERLVELAINFLKTKNYTNLLDIGTGSGAIAITLKKNLDIAIDACDISSKALDIAKKNSLDNSVNINFYEMDILKTMPNIKYDCLISNPPYVSNTEYTSPETKYEPSIALYAEDDGLAFYKRILDISPYILNEKGSIILEIGSTQGKRIRDYALKIYPNAQITIQKDYNNYDRYMFIEI